MPKSLRRSLEARRPVDGSAAYARDLLAIIGAKEGAGAEAGCRNGLVISPLSP